MHEQLGVRVCGGGGGGGVCLRAHVSVLTPTQPLKL